MNEKAMHTPGPWCFASYGRDNLYGVGVALGDYDQQLSGLVDHTDFTVAEPVAVDVHGAANAALIAAAPALYDTESKLCAEVSGLLDLYEEGMRALMGNTNFNVLKLRYDEARAALSAAKKQD